MITSRARSRDSTSWTWLVTVSASTVPRSVMRLLGLGPQKDIFAAFDQHARFGLVARRQQIDGDEGRRRHDQRRPDDRALVAPERARDRAEVQLPRRPSPRPAVLNATTHANSVLADSGDIPPPPMSTDYGCRPVKPARGKFDGRRERR